MNPLENSQSWGRETHSSSNIRRLCTASMVASATIAPMAKDRANQGEHTGDRGDKKRDLGSKERENEDRGRREKEKWGLDL